MSEIYIERGGQVELISRRFQGLILSVSSICHRWQNEPVFECSDFFHSWYDETEVVNNGFFVYVQYTYTLSLVVATCSESFGGKMVVRVACHFSNEC